MPFGPTNAPFHFQRVMEKIFGGRDAQGNRLFPFVTVYLDDICIASSTAAEHKQHLKTVLEMLAKHGIKLRIDKCKFAAKEVEHLGFLVSKYGICPQEKYKQKVLSVPEPREVGEVMRFNGLINYLARFIPNLHDYMRPLIDLTKGKRSTSAKVTLNAEQKHAFHELKKKVQNTTWMALPDVTKPFYVFTDASKYGVGAMLAQKMLKAKSNQFSFFLSASQTYRLDGTYLNKKFMPWYMHLKNGATY